MSIVLNEHYAAEEAIKNKSLGKKPSETLGRIARYYIDEYNITDKKAIRKKLDSFLLQCDPTASIPKWQKIFTLCGGWDSVFGREMHKGVFKE